MMDIVGYNFQANSLCNKTNEALAYFMSIWASTFPYMGGGIFSKFSLKFLSCIVPEKGIKPLCVVGS
jgi:hypothetical protein